MNQLANPLRHFSPDRRTLLAALQLGAERDPDRLLISCGDERWTCRETVEIAACHGARLAESGILRGDRVAIIIGNRAEFLHAFLGCIWIGAIAVPLNTAARGLQLDHMLRNSGARLLITDEAGLEALATVDFSNLAVECIWVAAGTKEALPEFDGATLSVWPQPLAPCEPADIVTGDPAAILYTSGTTGPSKGAICPHGQIFWYGINTGRAMKLGPDDVIYTTLPLFHMNALNAIFQASLYEASIYIDARFSVSGYWRAVRESGATVLFLLGAMVPMLLSRVEHEEERAHKVRLGSGPGVPEAAAAEFARRTGITLIEGYATTESNIAILSEPGVTPPGYMGKATEAFDLIVADDKDQPVPDGQPGELLLRPLEAFSTSLGYFGMPDKTVEAWRNLWLHTGDRVVRDADGNIRFLDRIKDAIRRRGENISSYEVEQVLVLHPAVSDAAVFPVSSEMGEDEVMAALVLADGKQVTAEEIIRFCEGRLSYFAIPRFLEFMSEFPKTDNGKVQKFKLRERGRSDATWDRETSSARTLKR